ncbi:XK-related protein 8-like [Megalobrama amblycephala]|uniref:XK-related protein 8-like n=1 Tax=Megalobrama amblycephala TaxID=75352 RepID=UPI0020141E07|nr:XK-related protein 8-like [Megalobrama amblycephala]XP_048057084.1 XK-related protein 8-like [Megalobrama amblycephala]
MEESFPFHYYLLEYLFVLVGLFFFLLDIALDIWTVVSFYQEGDYVYMAVMIFLLLGSSVLLQVFSWLWYSDCLDELETKVETFAKKHILIKPFHFLQLGVYLRYAGVIEISTKHFRQKNNSFAEGVAVYLNHDLQMLRLFEAFSESTPQLTLMMSIILQRGELELITGLKILTSAAAIASTVAMYHRSMRAFLQEKRKMSWISTGVYFMWNLLLIIPRVSALALFCSVLPCYIIAHFLSLWMLLVLGAWSQKTNLMEHSGWEWFYRATVGLIWYFSWFNISTGSIKLKTVLYYCVMGLDTLMLLGFWWWKVFEYTGCWRSLNPYIVIPILLGLYISGIILKMIYYRWFHPNCDEQKLAIPSEEPNDRQAAALNNDETDSLEASPKARAAVPAQPVTGILKRGRAMAANFYH